MVFIIKIPSKNKNQNQNNQPQSSSSVDKDFLQSSHPPVAVPTTPNNQLADPSTSTFTSTSTSQSSPQASPVEYASAAPLDILVAPAVINHQFLRSNDRSLIVERPERVFASLLAISNLWARCLVEQQTPNAGSRQGGEHQKDHLTSTLNFNSLKLNWELSSSNSQCVSIIPSQSPFNLIKTTRSLSLNPPHPSVAFIHADQGELFEKPDPTLYQIKQSKIKSNQERERRKIGNQEEIVDVGSKLEDQLSQINLNQSSLNGNEKSSILSNTKENKDNLDKKVEMITHSQYLDLLCSQAPHSPPRSSINFKPKSKARKSLSRRKLDRQSKNVNEMGSSSEGSSASSSSSSSDSEEEGDSHPSEVPLHLAQGDLYLKGPRPKKNPDDEDEDVGGSSEAIRHALGACAEAVDRVVWGAEFNQKMKLYGKSSDNGEEGMTSFEIGKEIPNHGALLLPSSSNLNSTPPLQSSNVTFNSSSTSHPPSSVKNPLPIPSTKSFVLTRPPGHHCGSGSSSSTALNSSVPSGFCWVNNVMVAAAHAHLNHDIERIVIMDLDLHHGNGTQSLAWRINEESFRRNLEDKAKEEAVKWSEGKGKEKEKKPLEIFYSSLHDIESYPCEDGNVDMIRDASTCVFGAHGQWIWNVHLESYDPNSATSFQDLYRTKYSILLSKAREFLSREPSFDPSKNLILLSTGFDSNEHELPGMQRHNKNVPTGFFEDFTRDSIQLADELCQGKLISLLEGGYSDRTLISGGLSHLKGFFKSSRRIGDDKESIESKGEKGMEFWDIENLLLIEKYYKKFSTFSSLNSTNSRQFSQEEIIRGLKIPKALDSTSPWLKKTFETFYSLNKVLLESRESTNGKDPALFESDAIAGDESASNTGRSLRNRNNLKSPEKWGDVSIGSTNSSPKVVKKEGGLSKKVVGSKTKVNKSQVETSEASSVGNAGEETPIKIKDETESSQIDHKVEDESLGLINSLNSMSMEEKK